MADAAAIDTGNLQETPLNTGKNRASAWPAVVSAIVAIAVYAITLHGSLVLDDLLITSDPRYTHPSLWWQFWTRAYIPDAIDNLYRPLTCMTLAIQYWIHGFVLWPYHLVNILLHAGAAAAVAELGRRLFGTRAAWIAGLLFAVHPIHVEVVAGVILRHESLCAIGMFSGACLFLRPMTGKRVLAIIGCFLLALLTKEQGVLFPVLLALLLPVRNRILGTLPSTSDNPSIDRKHLRLLFVALCWLLAGYLIYRESILRFWWPRQFMEWRVNPLVRSVGADRWLVPAVLLGRYLALMVAPVHLSVDYGSYIIGWKVDYHQPYVYIGLVSAALAALLLIHALRRRDWARSFLLMGLGLTYGMISNIATLIGTIFGERLFYLPSAFLLLLLARYVAQVRPRHLVSALVVIAAALGAVRTVTYAALWNHPEQLLLANIRQEPRSLSLYMLTANFYIRHHDNAAAQRIAHQGIEAMPDTWEAYANCIDFDMGIGDFADAWTVYQEGIARCPTDDMKRYKGHIAAAEEAAKQGNVPPQPPPGPPPDRL